MIKVYNTSKLFQEFHKISKDKVCLLQLTKRYVNNISFQNFLSVKDMNEKKDFLNKCFFLQKYHCQNPIKHCVQQQGATSVIECF